MTAEGDCMCPKNQILRVTVCIVGKKEEKGALKLI